MFVKPTLILVAALFMVAAVSAFPIMKRAGPSESNNKSKEAANKPTTCDSWVNRKMRQLNVSFYEFATMIVDGDEGELPFEFIVYCLMEDEPMANRFSTLQSEISKVRSDRNDSK